MQQHLTSVGHRAKVHALISTLTATEAPNGMDMFFRSGNQINLYLSSFLFLLSTCHILPCWSSDSCISLTPLPSASLFFLSSTRIFCWLFPMSHSRPPHLHILLCFFFLGSKKSVILFRLKRNQHIFFPHFQILFQHAAVNSSPHTDALWLPPPLHPVWG